MIKYAVYTVAMRFLGHVWADSKIAALKEAQREYRLRGLKVYSCEG